VAGSGDRHSKVGNRPELARTPEEKAAIEARNALRQFDRLREMIGEALAVGGEPFRLRPSALLELNRLAIENLDDGAGAYRTAAIEIGQSKHVPPDWPEVPRLVEDFCDYVNTRGPQASAVHLASYVMWRLNWIHPFPDGNGRTTRAGSYLVLCARLGYAVPGTRSIPEIIAGNKQPYYDALEEADLHWKAGRLEISAMESILDSALAGQLMSVLEDARDPRRGATSPVPATPGIRATATPSTPAHHRASRWSQKPRSFKIGIAGAAWQLLINWDNPRVQQVWHWVSSHFEEASSPAVRAPDPSGSRAQPGDRGSKGSR
jgi:fido (protein-threonine AMPylation protein)